MRNKREESSSGKSFSGSDRSNEKRSYSKNPGDGEKKPYKDSDSGSKSYFAKKREEGDSRFPKKDDERKSYASRSDSSRSNDNRDEKRTYAPRSEGSRYPSRDSGSGERKSYAPRGEESRYPSRDSGSSDRKSYSSRSDSSSSRSGEERKPYPSRSEGARYGNGSKNTGERKSYSSRSDSPRSGDRNERKTYAPRSEDSKYPSRDSGERKSYAPRGEESKYPSRDSGERKSYAPRSDSSRSNDRDEKKPYTPRGEGSKYPVRDNQERKPYSSRSEGSSRYGRDDEKRSPRFDGDRDERKSFSRTDNERPSRPRRDDADSSYEERASARMIDRNSLEDETRNTYIYGRHPVIEAINGQTSINKVWIAEGTRDTDQIVEHVKDKNIPYKIVSKTKLSYMVGEDTNHQGVVAEVAGKDYTELHDLVELAKQKEVFYIILDKLEDPHNLGAVIRTADAVGADAVIIPKHRAVGLTGIVTKSSAGAIDRMKICRVSNLTQAMDELKKANVWIVGVDMEGTEIYSSANLKNSIALTVGGEGEGLTKLVKENCDFIVKIPMQSKANSLNVSVATAVVAYEIFKQRDYKMNSAIDIAISPEIS